MQPGNFFLQLQFFPFQLGQQHLIGHWTPGFGVDRRFKRRVPGIEGEEVGIGHQILPLRYGDTEDQSRETQVNHKRRRLSKVSI